jgi:hypothetical protein
LQSIANGSLLSDLVKIADALQCLRSLTAAIG